MRRDSFIHFVSTKDAADEIGARVIHRRNENHKEEQRGRTKVFKGACVDKIGPADSAIPIGLSGKTASSIPKEIEGIIAAKKEGLKAQAHQQSERDEIGHIAPSKRFIEQTYQTKQEDRSGDADDRDIKRGKVILKRKGISNALVTRLDILAEIAFKNKPINIGESYEITDEINVPFVGLMRRTDHLGRR